jgi:3-hydroxyisobutyrate dehydrogenase-like beta-hydroxyacid dehydrogenase
LPPKGAAVNERAGFIGLGSMGEPMARALRRAGFPVTACAHHRREALERLIAADGVVEANDPAAVGSAVDVAFICVPDAPQVEDALFGEGGLVHGLHAGSVVVDCSTISPIASRSFAGRLAELGIAFVDAPVSGGPARAQAGTLTIMAGGQAEVYERVEPMLAAMGTPHRVGGVGMGETVKLVNQVVIANVMVANAEALTFAQRSGADLGAVREILKSATGSNYVLEQWLPKTWFAGTFEGGFALDLLRKDLSAALDAARAIQHSMPATALAYQLYTARSEEGDGALDYSAIAKSYERIADRKTDP